jgi:hypothetical protein
MVKGESKMDKKPLIGVSILAVVLLVLGSLTNVVGYQSVKSTVTDSPLFQTRTQRANNQQQNSITSQYLGMGKQNLLQFPFRDNRTEQLKKVIDIISKMDDKTFARLTELCIRKARQDNTLQNISDYQIVQALVLLKTNPNAVINSYANRNNQDGPTMIYTYCGGPYTVCGAWFPGCWILSFFEAIFFLIFLLPILLILNSFTFVWCDLP